MALVGPCRPLSLFRCCRIRDSARECTGRGRNEPSPSPRGVRLSALFAAVVQSCRRRCVVRRCSNRRTVVPALGDPRRERPPAVYGHFVNVPTHFNVKLPVISGHLPNADADTHLLVVSTCYNGQCKQMPRFRWSFQLKIACAHQNLRPSVLSNFSAVFW